MRHGKEVGLRRSAAVALPTAAIGVTFGLLAEPVLGAPAALLMSAVVWSGTAQFATLDVLATGGGAALASTTGLLANARYLPMGFAIAPSLRGGILRRAGAGVALTDASFAVAHRGRGRFDIAALAWSLPLQYLAWVGGTAAGVAGSMFAADPERFGLDVLFPVFYLGLLWPELRGSARAYRVAAASALVTLALVPIAPAGVPVLAAAATALLGLRAPPEG
jgi:predicted branched-subunit amino acid permease